MAVAFDAVGASSAGQSTTSLSPALPSLSWSHTCTGSQLAVIVTIAFGITSPSLDYAMSVSVTYGGVNMTSLGFRHSGDGQAGFVQMFGLVNPPVGASTIVATGAGTTNGSPTFTLGGGSVSLTGVNQVVPFSTAVIAAGNTTTPTVTITGTANGMIVDAVTDGTALVSSNRTLRFMKNTNNSSGAGNVASSTFTAAGATTMSYAGNATADFWAMIAVNVNAYIPPGSAGISWLSL